MSKVLITRSKLDGLATTIAAKSGATLPLTIAQMDAAVDGIVVGSGTDTSHDTVDAAHLLDGYTAHDSTGTAITGEYVPPTFTTQSKTATPTTSQQTVTPDSGYDGLSSVTVDAMPSGSATTPATSVTANPSITVGSDGLITATVSATKSITPTVSAGYVSSGTAGTVTVSGSATEQMTLRDSTDLTASGATVTAPAGYYASAASKAVASGTEGTPTATKGSVSNHAVSVTPSVTNTAGYITGGTLTGTAVTVAASELVSGTYTVSASGTHDVTNYASASVAAGGATASATKGTVSNHSVTVTPSVTRTAGYVTAGSANGTAVTVSASELVSGNKSITANGTNIDVTDYATVSVNVSGGSSMNVQVAQSTSRATSSTYTSVCSLTCSTAGTYDVYWDCFRSSTGGTSGSQLYVGGSAYGTANTTFSNHAQTNHLTGVSLSKNQAVAVYARSRGSNYYSYCGQLTIVQTA